MLNFGSCPLAKGHASPISGLYASCFLSTFPRQVDTITIEEIDRLARTPQLELPSHENGAVCLAATADIAAVCVFFFVSANPPPFVCRRSNPLWCLPRPRPSASPHREPWVHSVVISCQWDLNLDQVVEQIWEELDLLRVYTKKKGGAPEFGDAVIMRRGVRLVSGE